jgi:signal transduction histidine kinase
LTSAHPHPRQRMDGARKASILLVDDEPKNLYALRELLGSLDQNLLLADSGEEALRCSLNHDLAVILLDVRMPRMDGFETARLIRERARSRVTPIIFLTAAADEMGSVFRGYEVGAVDYLIKPLVPEVLRSKVSVFVDLYKKGADLANEIAERRLAEERVRESEEKLRALAAHLITVREEERTHIAREIHDELGQVLTGLKMELTWLAKRLRDSQKPLIEKTKSMFRLIDLTIQSVRRISAGLRPEMLDEMGLVAAIGWHAKEFQRRTGIRCRIKLPDESRTLDKDLSTTIFRIFQEILTNVARHSRATRVDVDISISDERLTLEVVDNGVGISERDRNDGKSLGLLGMQERALRFKGEIDISGSPGHGTRVAVLIPLAGGEA